MNRPKKIITKTPGYPAIKKKKVFFGGKMGILPAYFLFRSAPISWIPVIAQNLNSLADKIASCQFSLPVGQLRQSR